MWMDFELKEWLKLTTLDKRQINSWQKNYIALLPKLIYKVFSAHSRIQPSTNINVGLRN